MFRFHVPDMTCGHCVATITKAVQSVDLAAQVEADISRHEVNIHASIAEEVLAQAIKDAGYAVQPMDVEA